MGRRRLDPAGGDAGCWSETLGTRPRSVRLFERTPGGAIYLEYFDSERARQVQRSLGHRDRDAARVFAAQQLALADGLALAVQSPETLTLAALCAMYRQWHSPNKSREEQKADARRAAMWTALYGARRVLALGPAEWQTFARERAGGAIDAQGRRIPPEGRRVVFTREEQELRARAWVRDGKDGTPPPVEVHPRRPVRPGTVKADLQWLVQMCSWATEYQVAGRAILPRNPLGTAMPNIRRRKLPYPQGGGDVRHPLATYERYEAVRAIAETVTTSRGALIYPSYLGELLDLVEDTGRRITAICRLRADDLFWDTVQGTPAVVRVRWPPLKGEVPIFASCSSRTGAVLAGIVARRQAWEVERAAAEDRARRPLDWLFESPRVLGQPITRYLADKWLRRAEAAAGVPKLPGGLWHPYRRKWITERKDLPARDVAAAVGLRSERMVLRVYQQLDDATALAVLEAPRKLMLQDGRRVLVDRTATVAPDHDANGSNSNAGHGEGASVLAGTPAPDAAG